MLDAFDLDPALVHLNHGSFGAVPRVVAETQAAVRVRAEANPMRFFRVEIAGLKEEARRVAGDFLGVGADELALVRNVTEASGVVLSTLAAQGRLGPGDAVVVGEQGYGAVRRGVVRWCEQTGASLVTVPHPVDATDEEVVAGFARALAETAAAGRRVALVVVDHVTSPTGSVLPVAAICAQARAAGALSLVDAAHVPGQLEAAPDRLGTDFWTGTWHKWGFAPRGTSALWVSEAERATTLPQTTSWNHDEVFPLPFDTRGTDDYSAWFALAAAVRFWRQAGGAEIAVRADELLAKGADVVAGALPPTGVAGPLRPAPCLRLVALPDGVAATLETADALYETLSDHGLEVQVTPYGGRGWVRLSGAVYNRAEDYERLADVLPGLLPR